MGVDSLVFGVGDRVTGWGWLRELPDGVWFDPGGFWNLVGSGPPLSRHAVRLHDADLSAVATDHGPDGSIPGWATVTGVWLGDALAVERQSPHRPARPQPMPWSRPPCPPPPGGWPTGTNGEDPDNLTFDIGDLRDTGAAVAVTMFRPGPDQVVLVVAATDQDAVERRLRPQLGPRLCVVPSRWSRRQVDEPSVALREHIDDWTISSFGHGVDQDGQASVHVTVFRVLPELAQWASGLPDGLLRIEPTLTPAAG